MREYSGANSRTVTVGNECCARYGLEQFRIVLSFARVYDPFMNFSFSTPISGACLVKLWASGRYGFSLPKKVEITGPDGLTTTFLHHSRKVGLSAELANRTLVRIAIAQYLEGARGSGIEIDDTVAPYGATLTQIRPFAPPPPPPRVRPSRILPRAATPAAARDPRAKEAA